MKSLIYVSYVLRSYAIAENVPLLMVYCNSVPSNPRRVERPAISSAMYFLLKYNRGMDQFVYEIIKDYKLYTKEDKFCSYQTVLNEQDYNVYLFNQRGTDMLKDGWYAKYFKSNS